jgi:hypothetical protein
MPLSHKKSSFSSPSPLHRDYFAEKPIFNALSRFGRLAVDGFFARTTTTRSNKNFRDKT